MTARVAYAYTILYVDDVAAALTFYERGLGFERKLLTPEQDYGEVVSGSTTLAFASHELGAANFKAGYAKSDTSGLPLGIELAFATRDVPRVMKQALAEGATVLVQAVQKPWGQLVAYLRDPNGFILEICTPL